MAPAQGWHAKHPWLPCSTLTHPFQTPFCAIKGDTLMHRNVVVFQSEFFKNDLFIIVREHHFVL